MKESIKRLKYSIKRSKRSIYIKKSIYFILFHHYWSLSISFRSVLINSNCFDIFWTDNNQFRSDELKSGFKFGSKKLIKRRFDHDISRFGDLDRLHCLSLEVEPVVERMKHSFNKELLCMGERHGIRGLLHCLPLHGSAVQVLLGAPLLDLCFVFIITCAVLKNNI